MPWTEVVTAIGGSGATGAAMLAAARKMLKSEITDISTKTAEEANKPLLVKVDHAVQRVDAVVHDLTDVRLSLATQFGGNGGGMREAINSLQVQVARLEGSTARPSPTPRGQHREGD
jgi:hypothetical protein